MKLHDFEMIEKADVPGGYQCVLDYGDETHLSIISGTGAYGSEGAPYEVAVIKNGDFIQLPGIVGPDDDVRGHLTEDEVNAVMKKLYLITATIPEQV